MPLSCGLMDILFLGLVAGALFMIAGLELAYEAGGAAGVGRVIAEATVLAAGSSALVWYLFHRDQTPVVMLPFFVAVLITAIFTAGLRLQLRTLRELANKARRKAVQMQYTVAATQEMEHQQPQAPAEQRPSAEIAAQQPEAAQAPLSPAPQPAASAPAPQLQTPLPQPADRHPYGCRCPECR